MFLLDTHALVWAINQPELLSPNVAAIVESGDILVSAASLWELLIKKDRKDAPIKNPNSWWQHYITLAGVQVLAIQACHIRLLETLPPAHKDPFDRILICQSIYQGIPLVTNDQAIHGYEAVVSLIW